MFKSYSATHTIAMNTPNIIIPKQKGIGICHISHFVRERFGEQKWQTVLSNLSNVDAREVSASIAIAWHDLGLFARLLHSVVDTCSPGDLSILSEIGAYEADQDLGVFIKFIIKTLSPISVVRSATKIWNRIQNTGEWEINTGHNMLTGMLKNWGVIDRYLCLELMGYLKRLIEYTGVTNVKVKHTRCRADGYNACHFDAEW
ncbi:MAG: hypothetical protein JW841_14450 [Deltaproteobacteria bacterium]|nr:hypothetical protein [Deltaproteobacteria bacterium]